ncbi:MAG: tetratricopeptide repeat protein [Deltaproteobacteria bacterium]|nr:tetratricopeptide repeat protein [Deltaproteobacteria bacterium]
MTACVETNRVPLYALCILIFLVCMSACAPVRIPAPSLPPSAPAPVPERPAPPAPLPEPTPVPVPEPPRHTASLQLTDQGRILVEHKSFDDAIRVLERAIALNPRNGENYYYMAEAWLGKGSARQAGEFNRLAGMYLVGSHWEQRIEQQRRAIEGSE